MTALTVGFALEARQLMTLPGLAFYLEQFWGLCPLAPRMGSRQQALMGL